MNYSDHQPKNGFLDPLASSSFIPYILHSTTITSHSKTLTDNIFPSTQKFNFYERDWSKFKQENFIIDYFDKDWSDLLQIDQQNVNLSMESFLNNMNSILDTHAPLKK